jgi:hypothetical protein
MNREWKINNASVTNGAAYADLDNDGDLDIVGNNMDGQAIIYENHSSQLTNGHYLQIKLVGPEKNPNGIGARITLRNGDETQIREQYFSRGYQSAISDVLHFGLGDEQMVDELEIQWPDSRIQLLKNIKANQKISLIHKDASKSSEVLQKNKKSLFDHAALKLNTVYKHSENEFDDFEREYLLPHKLSQFGPGLAVGDVNGDNLDDFYVGGAHNQSGKLFVQISDGKFQSIAEGTFANDKYHEDVGAIFFDAENDGDLDLYVVSGGNELNPGDPYYADRFYENTGSNQFKRNLSGLPQLNYSGSNAVPCDFDLDGDIDLFVGGRLKPGAYPFPGTSIILKNESKPGAIKFIDATEKLFPELQNIGMVSDALWLDLDNDSYKELLVVGEWMAVKVFKNLKGKKFKDISKETGLSDEVGWWSSLASGDFDKDGDMDIVAGNLGLNYKYKASKKEPFEVYAKDFDNNGKMDIVLGFYEEGILYPLRGKNYLTNRMPFIRSKFPSYHDFAIASMTDVFGQENMNKSLNYKATNFATCYMENLGDGTFSTKPLPNMAQLSSVNTILIKDFDVDGHLDVLVAGNFYQSEMETPRNDASVGMFLKGDGKGHFEPQPPVVSGLYIDGDTKGGAIIDLGQNKETHILVAKNNDFLQLVKVENGKKDEIDFARKLK